MKSLRINCQLFYTTPEFEFNVDFAPVADVLTNSENKVVKMCAFVNDEIKVSEMALLVKQGLKEGIFATYKHFSGHGSTTDDSHADYAYSDSTLEELENCELIPFETGIKERVSFIMVGHIPLSNVIEDDTLASLSKYIIYDGIVITHAMNLGLYHSNILRQMPQ